jgi:hypothetical protein
VYLEHEEQPMLSAARDTTTVSLLSVSVLLLLSPTLERLYIESGCPLEFLQSSTVNADVAIFIHFANYSNKHELLESLNIRHTARTRPPTRSVHSANVSCQSSLYAIHQLTLNYTRVKQWTTTPRTPVDLGHTAECDMAESIWWNSPGFQSTTINKKLTA